jgi:hypothetical protein
MAVETCMCLGSVVYRLFHGINAWILTVAKVRYWPHPGCRSTMVAHWRKSAWIVTTGWFRPKPDVVLHKYSALMGLRSFDARHTPKKILLRSTNARNHTLRTCTYTWASQT